MTAATPPRRRTRIPPKETLSILARASRGGLITVARAAEALGVANEQAVLALASLARRGWIARARRGLYLVLPVEAGGGPVATADDPWVLAQEMYAPCYIAGWSAAEHWGLTEQLFRSTFVATAAPIRVRSQRILGLEFHLARVAPTRIESALRVWRGRERVAVSDSAATIADALASPNWVGGVRHLAHILATYRTSQQWDAAALLARLAAIDAGAAFKRLGYLVEALRIDAPMVVETALAQRTTGVVRLDPANRERGRMTKRWGLWVNAGLEASEDGA